MDKRTFKICEAVHLGLDYYYMAEKDKWLTFKNPRICIGMGKPEWGAEIPKEEW